MAQERGGFNKASPGEVCTACGFGDRPLNRYGVCERCVKGAEASYGRPRVVVRRRQRKSSPPRFKHPNSQGNHTLSSAKVDEIGRMFDALHSGREIAVAVGCSRNTVSRYKRLAEEEARRAMVASNDERDRP